MIETTAPTTPNTVSLPIPGASPWPGRQPFFGYHLPNLTFPGVEPDGLFEHLVGLAAAAEGAGFDLLTVMDHFYQIGGVGPETNAMLESGSLLAALAARTSRVHLGTLVTGVTYRNPAFFAKSVTTLDVISGGRAMFGLGAAWNESEHDGYGYDFPAIGERMDRLDEALTIARLMFTEDRPTFVGEHYRIERALNEPKPIQAGGPPILIGGGGEKRTLRIAATHASMTHWFAQPLDALRHKTEVLEGHCEAVGRDPSTIVKTLGSPVLPVATERDAEAALERIAPERRALLTPMTPEQGAEKLATYVAEGFTGFTFREHDAPPRRGPRGRRGDAAIASLIVRTERLELQPIPNLAGVALRVGDRARGAAALGVALDPEWPAPDLLDVLPGTEPFGAWAIVEGATSTVVGDIGFHGPPDLDGVVEIGYSIVPSRRRRGYAVEAARALLEWAIAQAGIRGIVAGSAPDNAASIATLERLGFVRTGEADGELRWTWLRP